MSEAPAKANAAPLCLCGLRHWSSQRELCKFYTAPPEIEPVCFPAKVKMVKNTGGRPVAAKSKSAEKPAKPPKNVSHAKKA